MAPEVRVLLKETPATLALLVQLDASEELAKEVTVVTRAIRVKLAHRAPSAPKDPEVLSVPLV